MASTAQPQTELGKKLQGEICPDPSVHEKHHHEKRLQDTSAAAALYVTHPERATNVRDMNPLGPDGKLSSAGAATSLKYARAQDLPSYPSVGIDTKNSGLAAASIAHANPKDVRYPEVGMSSDNAHKAANLAAGYKMKPLWQPEQSAAGSKAAMLAAQGKGRDWWQPTASKDGLQAATLAAQNKNLGPNIYQGNTPDGKNKALIAATLSVKGRKRSDSTPEPQPALYPDSHNSKVNSLKAATSVTSRANEQSRIVHARNLSREMYTSHPDVSEFDKKEKAHQDALRGASISMAKKMYAIEKVDDQGHVQLTAGQRAAAQSANRSSVSSEQDLKQQAMQYLTLQDAAQRLAAERLARIEDQNESAAFRDYYGYGSKRKSRLTLKGRNRRRASSEGAAVFRSTDTTVASEPTSPDSSVPYRRGNLDIDSDDEEQAARIRNQQNAFNSKLRDADNKRMNDQRMLLAAAEKKVQAQMSKMDQKVFNETGKMSPAMMEEWDSRARQKAAAASQMRMQNHGKVDIGGGKFLDQSEIDAIALAKIKPTLDEIHETAEKQRARDEEIRLEQEQARREAQTEKERQQETKLAAKRMKAEDKEAEKARKRDAKIAAEHEKTAAKEQKQREKDAAREEKQRTLETTRVNEAAAADSARVQERKSREVERPAEPETPKEKKSLWKRISAGGGKSEREPGKISASKGKGIADVPEDEYTAATRKSTDARPSTSKPLDSHPAEKEKEEEKAEEKKDSPVLTPTGATMAGTSATMAGDGPSTIAAPERLPETEAAIDEQATTPMEEREPKVSESSFKPAAPRPVKTEDDEEVTSPASPSKKRFSRLMGKLKRNKRDEKDVGDKAETASFTGGAKLHKQRQDESRNASGTTSSSVPAAPAAAATSTSAAAPAERSRSPSISSLSSSDDEVEEERGRSMTRLDQVASHVAAIKDSDSDGEFEEARDKFDGGLEPPRDILSKKHGESPVRDSRFVENI